MWAAGSAGTIAVSSDAGQHWQKKSQNPAAGLLLAFSFVNNNFGFAAGTGDSVLLTQDGGETWNNAVAVPETVFQAAFGDPLHGVIRARSSLLCTTDGKTWKPLIPANDSGWMQKYPYTTGMAALDGAHLIVHVSQGEAGDGEFLSTSDGGQTWTANYVPSVTGMGKLFSGGGEYWSVGGEVVGKGKPGGGGNIPMALRSSDGVQWDHLPVFHDVCHWEGCGGCTFQGCFAGRSSFVPFSRILDRAQDSPTAASLDPLDRFPDHILSGQWARTGDTLCLLTRGTVECSTLTPVATLDTRDDGAEWDDVSFPPLGPSRIPTAISASIETALPHGVRCIRCNLEKMYFSEKGKTGPVDVEITFTIEPGGRAGNLSVRGSLPEDVSSRIRSTALEWLFEPYAPKGQVKPLNIDLRGRVMILAKP